ncbi:MAG: outer membrane beta-barrel protein [Desulfuromonadaceae bacterium]|nr:outer membrane beta-barrel protein [Desulfuromonadaceae bacterium]
MWRFTVSVVCVLLLVTSSAFAGPIRTYVGASAGFTLPGDSTVTDADGISADVTYDPGLSLSGFVGHEFGMGLRLEGEVNYKKTSVDKFKLAGTTSTPGSDFESLGIMANAYYDFLTNRNFTPYAGGGIGFSSATMSSADVNGQRMWNSDNATAFAYQVGLGCSVMIDRRTAFDLGYRYYATGDYKIDQVTTKVNSHNIMLGLKYYIY